MFMQERNGKCEINKQEMPGSGHFSTEAPFTLKRFHSYTEQLLRIAFCIPTVYIDTNSQEYEEAKGAKTPKPWK